MLRGWDKYKGEKDISACGLIAFINQDGERCSGEKITQAMTFMRERGNGLGAGYAAYGIYPEYKDYYALHLMFDTIEAKKHTEEFLYNDFQIVNSGEIQTKGIQNIKNSPIHWRYFVEPLQEVVRNKTEEDFVVEKVMEINKKIDGAFVTSSGKNMGCFKGVGYPEDIAEFFMLDTYQGHTWLAHSRFPTNSPGWWGGAHPFNLLDWSIVHNGEISSYGTNKRYLEMFGYECSLMTDTEVVAYLIDLLVRRHKLPFEIACSILAPPFWKRIDVMDERARELYQTLRVVYASALLNGPFAFVIGHKNGIIGLSDRVKLRPLVAAVDNNTTYISSEEAAIIGICPNPERIWHPKAGEPVIAEIKVPVA